jgi:uncharacterized membrane protein YeaQ/YmgE (transglycosylase-associated protein family)
MKMGGDGMHWIVTLIVGAVVGWLASIIMKTNAQMGAIANIVVGPIVGWIVAVLGAAVLIFILKAVGIFA